LNFPPATTWLALLAWFAYVVPTVTVFVRTVWFASPGPAARVPAVTRESESVAA